MSEEEFNLLRYVLKDNRQAVSFMQIMARISQTYDDLIDKDREIQDNEIHDMMWNALVSLPENPFYRAYIDELTPMVRSVINDWRTSIALERGSEQDRLIAYMIRDSMASLLCQCAYLVGGYDWMNEVSVRIRRHVHDESQKDYFESLEQTSCRV